MTLPADHVTACIAFGANVGRRLSQLRAAYNRLAGISSIDIVASSPVYASEAHTLAPDDTAPDYLNAVVQVETGLSPEDLLAVCQAIERNAGREREENTPPWAPRPLDLDILTYGQQTIDTATLTVPHPRLAERRFVLQPWADVAPNLYVPPPFEKTVQQLLDRCPDTATLRRTPHALKPTPSAPD